MFKNSGCEIGFDLQVNAYKIVIIFKHNKNEDTAHCYLTCNLKFFTTACLLIKSFKVKMPADPFDQNLSDFFGGKKFCTQLSLPQVLTGTVLRYTRNTIRYISNAGGWDGMFFYVLTIK
jgi:hypothetical protein